MVRIMDRAKREAAEDLTRARSMRIWNAAVGYLRGWLTPQVQAQIREAIQGPDWPAAYHLGYGMHVRNALRTAGFGERQFEIRNMDNIYVELVEQAVMPVCEHPEFTAVVDVFPGDSAAKSRFEASIKIACARCGCVMLFSDCGASPTIRVRLDPDKEEPDASVR